MTCKSSRHYCKLFAVARTRCHRLYSTTWLPFPYFQIYFQIYPCSSFLSSYGCLFIFHIFHLPEFFHSCPPFSEVTRRSAHNVKNDVHTFRTELVKRVSKSRTKLFTLSKQTFPSQHVTFLKQPIIYGLIDVKRKKH